MNLLYTMLFSEPMTKTFSDRANHSRWSRFDREYFAANFMSAGSNFRANHTHTNDNNPGPWIQILRESVRFILSSKMVYIRRIGTGKSQQARPSARCQQKFFRRNQF